MADPKKAPGWTVELLPVGGDPDAPSRRLMELQFSPDMETLQVQRMGPDGKLQSFAVQVDGPADVNRLFAAEVVGMIGAQANQNFRAQGLETTQANSVSFTPEGDVVSEIYQRGVLFRRAVFDPAKLELTVTGESGRPIASNSMKEMEDLPILLAKALGVTLPLGSTQ
jgi:hypothetical protein